MNISLDRQNYVDHEYNGTITNERCIEIALANRYIEDYPDFVEVGGVMPYYGKVNHLVYDPYDKHESCIKEFAENVDFSGKNVLSISTIEHFGETNGYGPYFSAKDIYASERFINKLFIEANSFFISIPMGQHPRLNEYLKLNLKRYICFAYVKLIQEAPLWMLNTLEKSDDIEYIINAKYAYPFPCANAVLFLTKNVILSR